jgi:hypothetical protein
LDIGEHPHTQASRSMLLPCCLFLGEGSLSKLLLQVNVCEKGHEIERTLSYRCAEFDVCKACVCLENGT